MQDPNEDTEWNDILRAKGIIPEKPKEAEVTEDDIVKGRKYVSENVLLNVPNLTYMKKDKLDHLSSELMNDLSVSLTLECYCRCWRRR